MNWRILAFAGALLISSCTAPASNSPAPAITPQPTQPPTSSPGAAAPAKATAQPAAPQPAQPAPKAPAPASVDGVRVTVNGQPFDVAGEVKVDRQTAMGVSMVYIGRNARPSALVGGNGVLLELQTMQGKNTFAAADIGVVTFTVWKGVDFSYISVGGLPNRPVEGLVLSQTPGRLAGSFESNLSGSMGKFPAKIEFGVALPD